MAIDGSMRLSIASRSQDGREAFSARSLTWSAMSWLGMPARWAWRRKAMAARVALCQSPWYQQQSRLRRQGPDERGHQRHVHHRDLIHHQ